MKNYANFIRTALIFAQAALDTFLCWLSFHAVIIFWMSGRGAAGFSFEVMAFFSGTMLAVFYFNSLYEFRNWIFWDEVKAVMKSSALILPVIVLYLYSQKFDLSRFVLASGLLFFVPLCLTARYVFRRIFFALGLLETHIIILGAGKTGELFARNIVSHPFTACKVIGFLDDDDAKQGTQIAGFPVLGRLDDFEGIYAACRIDEAAVAISTASRSLLTHILDIVEFRVRQVHYIPDLYMLTTFSATIGDVDGMPVISASQGLRSPFNRVIKCIMDYTGAVAALVIFSPVMLWAAYRIKREDGGDIFTVQERVGWKTKHFNVFRFRITRTDTGKRRRLTKMGALLRRSGIDELPQLFNVLRGEMSLVGPRPLYQREVDIAYGGYIAGKI